MTAGMPRGEQHIADLGARQRADGGRWLESPASPRACLGPPSEIGSARQH